MKNKKDAGYVQIKSRIRFNVQIETAFKNNSPKLEIRDEWIDEFDGVCATVLLSNYTNMNAMLCFSLKSTQNFCSTISLHILTHSQ